MRYIITILLALVFFLVPDTFLLDSETPNFCKACSYHFFHGNIFHLAVNCLSLNLLMKGRPKGRCMIQLGIAYFIGVAVWFIAPRPIIGISNILFAVGGLRTPSIKDKWWRSEPAVVFFSVTFLMFLFPNLSALTHIASFLIGALIAGIGREIKSTENDYKHAVGR